MSRSRRSAAQCSTTVANTKSPAESAYEIIKDLTDLYVKMIDLYEKLGGEVGVCDELDLDDDTDLPITDEEVSQIQNNSTF